MRRLAAAERPRPPRPARVVAFGVCKPRESPLSEGPRGVVRLCTVLLVCCFGCDLFRAFSSAAVAAAATPPTDALRAAFARVGAAAREPWFRALFGLAVFPGTAYLIEVCALLFSKRSRLTALCTGVAWVNTVSCVLLPPLLVALSDGRGSPLGAGLVALLALALGAKLHSWHHVLLVLRSARRHIAGRTLHAAPSVQGSSDSDCSAAAASRRAAQAAAAAAFAQAVAHYPRCLTLPELFYFLVAPTLCYDVEYPRTERVRWGRLLRSLVELLLGTAVCKTLLCGHALPALQDTLLLWTRGATTELFFCALLRFTWVVVLLFVLGSYVILHAFGNALAEVLRFGDQLFYDAWWDAESMQDFWRLWCPPLYLWTQRHIFAPLRNIGLPRKLAIGMCFAIGVGSFEVVALAVARAHVPWIFPALLLGLPLSALLSRATRRNSRLGNAIMWTNIAVWVPVLTFLYTKDFFLPPAATAETTARTIPG